MKTTTTQPATEPRIDRSSPVPLLIRRPDLRDLRGVGPVLAAAALESA